MQMDRVAPLSIRTENPESSRSMRKYPLHRSSTSGPLIVSSAREEPLELSLIRASPSRPKTGKTLDSRMKEPLKAKLKLCESSFPFMDSSSVNSFEEADVELNLPEVNMFRDIFNMYDKDGNNTIDCSELKLILEELGYECSTDEVLKVISKFDLNTTGTIDFNEFLSLIGDWMSNDENQIRDAFEVFDKEGNGYLSLEQLKRALTTYGEAFTDNEAEEFFKEIDVDGDGTITADEFIQYIKGVNS